jgi:hypothetical protein
VSVHLTNRQLERGRIKYSCDSRQERVFGLALQDAGGMSMFYYVIIESQHSLYPPPPVILTRMSLYSPV